VLERVRGASFARERFETLLVNRAQIQALHHVPTGAHERSWLAAREPAGWPSATLRPWVRGLRDVGYA